MWALHKFVCITLHCTTRVFRDVVEGGQRGKKGGRCKFVSRPTQTDCIARGPAAPCMSAVCFKLGGENPLNEALAELSVCVFQAWRRSTIRLEPWLSCGRCVSGLVSWWRNRLKPWLSCGGVFQGILEKQTEAVGGVFPVSYTHLTLPTSSYV